MIGKSIAHYQVVGEIGSGGMGVVFRARDGRLDRDVAIKALPEELSRDGARLARFEREARILAKLNHQHIGSIYGLEVDDGQMFLVLELVEGRTLAEVLARGPLDLAEVLRLSRQIAEALAAAHDSGIVHRDLKPANIKVSPDGQIKILDFGLAKAAPARADRSSAASDTTTAIDPKTAAGTVLGTAPYMSPEQARGEPVDVQTDVWAFGCLVFEMSTGRRAFDGPTRSDLTAAILREEPDWTLLPPETPGMLRQLMAMCLAKDKRQRARNMSDLRLLLTPSTETGADSTGEFRLPPPPKKSRFSKLWVAGLLALGLAAGFLGSRLVDRNEQPGALQIPMAPPEGLKPSLGYGPSLAISPSGRYLAYVLETGTTTTLYVKGPDDLEARPIAGTKGARTPFFSPGDRWVAFFDERQRKLKKVSLGGGEPVTMTGAESVRGAVWASDGTILFGSGRGGIFRVSAEEGGEPELLIEGGAWPSLLPGGEVVLYTTRQGRGSFDEAKIVAMPLAGRETRVILESAYYPHYASTGHLVFVQGDSVLAAPFDPEAVQITGPATTVIERVWTSSWIGYADFAFSDSGTLVYVAGGPNASRARLVRVDRDGSVVPLLAERRPYRVPRFSPDGEEIALTITDEQVDVWTFELKRRVLNRLTDSPSWDAYPQWRPGSDSIAFASMRDGLPAIYIKDLMRGTVERAFETDNANFPGSWSPDGKLLAYQEDDPDTGSDIWIYSFETDSRSPFLATPHLESTPEFSPDGRFIAYESDQTGQQEEIYVRPYPEGNPQLKISTAGGRFPRWNSLGDEIYYWVGGKMMAVAVETEPELTAGSPRLLFAGSYGAAFDASPDGRSFLMLEEMADTDPPMRINMVANWFQRLKTEALSAR